MKRLSWLALVCAALLVASGARAAPRWISLGDKSGAEAPPVVLLAADPGSITFRFHVPGFLIEDVVQDGVTYQRLSLPGESALLSIGKPELPIITETICVPAASQLTPRLIDSSATALKGYRVLPTQTPLGTPGEKSVFAIDSAFYASDSTYPDEFAVLDQPGIWRDLHVMRLQVRPFQYNPVSGVLTVRTEFTIRIDSTAPFSAANCLAGTRPISPAWDQVYRGAVINYPSLALPEAVSADKTVDHYDYLVIADTLLTTPECQALWSIFQAHKQQRGISVQVRNLQRQVLHFGPRDPAAIRDYIAQEFQEHGIIYVLLAGTNDLIPGYNGSYDPGYTDSFRSDFYYSLLVGYPPNDNYPDVGVGRLLVDYITELSGMLNKTMAFENAPANESWTHNALMIAARTDGARDNEALIHSLSGGTAWSLQPTYLYGNAYDSTCSDNIDIKTEMNTTVPGAFHRFVAYSGHGDISSWLAWNCNNESFGTYQVGEIYNWPALIFSFACDNNFISSPSCLGGSFLANDYGAAAFLGASAAIDYRSALIYSTTTFDQLFGVGVPAISLATNVAAVKVIQGVDYLGSTYYDIGLRDARRYLWLGDPSLRAIPGPPPAEDNVPDLAYPYAGMELSQPPLQVVLNWQEVAGAASYEVRVSNVADFSVVQYQNAALPTNQWPLPTLARGWWYWQARTNLAGGGQSAWSESRSFRVVRSTPDLTAPLSGITYYGSTLVSFRWYPLREADSFDFQLSSTSDFSGTLLDAAQVSFDVETTNQPWYPNEVSYDLQIPNEWEGQMWWRVRIHNPSGYNGDLPYGWSEVRTLYLNLSATSCPVLYRHDGAVLAEENPLLTACERSGYREVVTDYYTLTGPLGERNGTVTLQLREMADEITYLDDFGLLVIDHAPEVRIACDGTGVVHAYDRTLRPLSAVDDRGVDRLEQVVQRDGLLFEATGSGYLDLLFANPGSEAGLLLTGGSKLPCPAEEKRGTGTQGGGSRPPTGVQVEIALADGQRVLLPAPPFRERPSLEYVSLSSAAQAAGNQMAIRISWDTGFATDCLEVALASALPLAIQDQAPVATRQVASSPPGRRPAQAAGSAARWTLVKGDALEFDFRPAPPAQSGSARAYCVRASGRYEPDYDVYVGLRPTADRLYANAPNPFNPLTTIRYDVAEAGMVRLDIFDLQGRLVRRFADEWRPAGRYQLNWDATSSSGGRVASGTYLCRLTTGRHTETRSMLLVK